MEEATQRLNSVLAEYVSTNVQLRREIDVLRAEIVHLRAVNIKEEPTDPLSLIKEEPESDAGETHSQCVHVPSNRWLNHMQIISLPHLLSNKPNRK